MTFSGTCRRRGADPPGRLLNHRSGRRSGCFLTWGWEPGCGQARTLALPAGRLSLRSGLGIAGLAARAAAGAPEPRSGVSLAFSAVCQERVMKCFDSDIPRSADPMASCPPGSAVRAGRPAARPRSSCPRENRERGGPAAGHCGSARAALASLSLPHWGQALARRPPPPAGRARAPPAGPSHPTHSTRHHARWQHLGVG